LCENLVIPFAKTIVQPYINETGDLKGPLYVIAIANFGAKLIKI